MEVVVTSDGILEKELLVTVHWEDIRADYEQLLKRYSRLSVRGFRPGKSPLGLVESSFAEPIRNDLVAAASMRLCRRALNTVKLEAGSPIEVSEVILRKKEFLRFKAAFIEMPVFILPDYASLNLQSGDGEGKLDEISQKLLDRTDIRLHPGLIENELKYSEEAGADREANAEARVKLMLILKKIASQDRIEVDERDVEDRITTVAAENGVTAQQLKTFLVENRGLSRFTDSLLAEAVLDYIVEIQN